MKQINSVYLTIDSPLINKDKLEFLIGELLWEGEETYGVHVMRCKGIFMDSSAETPQLTMLQGVEDLFEIKEVADQKQIDKAKFLFVVRGQLDQGKLLGEIQKRCQQ